VDLSEHEVKRFCAFLLAVVGLLYVVGAVSDSAIVWSLANAVSLLTLLLLAQERVGLEMGEEFFYLFSILFIPAATLLFLNLPEVREKVLVLALVATNLELLLKE